MNEPGSPVIPLGLEPVVRPRTQKKPASVATGVVDAVETVPGLCFQHGGYLHEVVAIDTDGAVTKVGEGEARLGVSFGSVVRVLGVPRVLAHPNHGIAFERLRSWRTRRANGKPAYTVLADDTLRALSVGLPLDEGGLAALKGIGPVKLEAFGEELLILNAELRDL